MAQVTLRWLVQERVVAIPGAQNVEQLRENLKVLDFTLTNDEGRHFGPWPVERVSSPEARSSLGPA